MTDQHPPIVSPPPQGLMEAWQARIESMGSDIPEILLDVVHWGASKAARAERDSAVRSAEWGADVELEAVIHWLITGPYGALIACHADRLIADLRAARRPKPQSELTDEQLIAAAEQAGLCYPVCWDLRGKDAPQLRYLRGFARAIVAELRGQDQQNTEQEDY